MAGAPVKRASFGGCDRRVAYCVGLLTACARAAADEGDLRASWRLEVGAGVEWAECVSSAGPAVIIVASRDDRVRMVDPATGAPKGGPVGVGAGTRLAGAEGAVAYLFDRYVVYGLQSGESAGRVLWRSGRWPPGGDAGDDPEFLTPVIAARACSGGVLAVRSDGRLALLDEQTGRPRWQQWMPPLSHCRLLVGPDAGVVLCNPGGRTVGLVLRPLAEPRSVTTVAPGGGWPIWGTLDGEQLVGADSRGVRRVPLDGGEVRVVEAPQDERLLAAAIDGEWREVGDAEGAQRDSLDSREAETRRLTAVWAGSDRGAVYRFDLAAGAAETVIAPQFPNTESWAALRVTRRAVLVRSDRRLVVIAPDVRRVMVGHDAAAAEVICTAEIIGQTVYAVLGPASAGEPGAAARLLYFPIPDAASPAATRAAQGAAPASRESLATARHQRLSGGERGRHWLWVGSRLVAVEPDALAGYELPAPAAPGD